MNGNSDSEDEEKRDERERLERNRRIYMHADNAKTIIDTYEKIKTAIGRIQKTTA